MATVLLLGVAFVLLRPEPEPLTESLALAGRAERQERSEALRRLAERPAPPARGALSIRGQVLGPNGPVAGVLVSARAARPLEGPEADVARPSTFRNAPFCDDRPELRAYLEEREAREEEEAPRAWALTDTRGAFQLDGLESGTYLVWAESPDAEVALRADVPAGGADVVLRSSPGRFLSGLVSRQEGGTLAGAHVFALLEGVGHVVHAVSAEDGRFRLGPLPRALRPTLLVTHADRLPSRWSHEYLRSDEELPFSLVPLQRVSGRVVDARGPVAGARVEVATDRRLSPSVTDAQGHFQVGPVCQRAPEVLAVHGGRYARRTVESHAQEVMDDVELVLAGTTLRLDGRVQDGAGRPLANVAVTLRERGFDTYANEHPSRERLSSPADTLILPLVRQTDARGAFAFESLVPGDYLLRFQAAHHVAQQRPLALGDTGQHVIATLAEAQRLEGRVVDTDGRGVPDARVSAGDLADPVQTDAHGAFTLEVDASRVLVEVRHPDFPPLSQALQAPARDVRLELAPGASLEVELVDEHERPVPQARILCARRQAYTDEDGRALLKGLAPGTWDVVALPTESGARVAQTRLDVKAGQPQHVRLRLSERWTLTGQLVDEDGEPLAGVSLRALPVAALALHWRDAPVREAVTARSGPDGGFSLPGLSHEDWRLIVSSPPAYWSEHRVSPERPHVRLVMKARPTVRGRVVDETGTPLTTFKLQGQPHTHPEGLFSQALSSEERVKVSLQAPEREGVEFWREPGEGGDVGDVVLRKYAPVSGQVIDALTRAPLGDARVFSQDSHTRSSLPDGRFTLTPSLSIPDSVRVSAAHSGYFTETRSVPEGTREVRLELRPGATLEGRVEVEGRPVPTGRILLRSESTEFQRGVEFWDGRYRVNDLEAGTYVLHAQGQGPEGPISWSSVHRVSLTMGEHKTEDLLAPHAPTGTVEVLVAERTVELHLLPGRFPLIGPEQGLYRRLAQEGRMGRLMREGTRRFSDLPAGPYTLLAIKRDEAGTEVHREELEVSEGESTFTLVPQWQRFEDAPTAVRP